MILYTILTLIITSIYIDPVFIKTDKDISSDSEIKTYKVDKTENGIDTIKKNSSIWVRETGGIGDSISLHIDGSQPNQIDYKIDGFNFKSPILAKFSSTASFSGFFDKIELQTFNLSKNLSSNSHSGVVDFKLPNKNRYSIIIGSFGTSGAGFNTPFKIFKGDFNLGAIFLKSENNYRYRDFNNRDRVRKNNHFQTLSLYLKSNFKNFDSIELINFSYKGTPGSVQFEHLEANISTIENLIGLKKRFQLKNFNFTIETTYNYKNYIYLDSDPEIIGLEREYYPIIFHDFTNSALFEIPIFSSILSFNIIDQYYIGSFEDKRDNIDKNRLSISTNLSNYLYKDRVIINLGGKYYIEDKKYQYDLSISYQYSPFDISLYYQKGLRFPFFEENYYRGDGIKGDPNLKPEKIDKYGLKYLLKFKNIIFEGSFFYSEQQNTIVFLNSSFNLLKASNLKPVKLYGGDFAVKFNYNFINIENRTIYTNSEIDTLNTYIPYIPKYQNRLLINLLYKSYKISIFNQYSSIYYNDIYNSDKIKERSLWNIDFSYRYLGNIFKFEVKNLTDRRDIYNSRHIPLPSRGYFFKWIIFL